MIAVLHSNNTDWIPANATLLTSINSIPFAVEAVVCNCHNLTWVKPQADHMLVVVTWGQ